MKRTALVVDDEAAIRLTTAAILEANGSAVVMALAMADSDAGAGLPLRRAD